MSFTKHFPLNILEHINIQPVDLASAAVVKNYCAQEGVHDFYCHAEKPFVSVNQIF